MGAAPENTLASFRRAVESGCDEIELDLRLTSDGEIVILHDADLSRTHGLPDAVVDLSLARLRELAPDVPTFAEVVAAIAIGIQAEIKADGVPDVLVPMLEADPDLAGRVLVTSFKPDALARVHELRPTAPLGLIFGTAPEPAELVERGLAVHASWVMPGLAGLTRDHVDAAHAAGLKVAAWPVPDDETLAAARALGVDGVTTDNAHTLRRP